MTSPVPAPDRTPGDPAAVLPPPARQAVERIISDVDGAATTVVAATVLADRDHVLRVVAASGTQAVVKRARTGTPGRWGLDPEGFPTEWAALEHLADVPGAPAVGLLGGDADAGVLVIEHLDVERTVADSLLGADGDVAAADVVAYGTLLGTVHGWTLGRSADLEARRRRHGVADPATTRWAVPLRRNRDAFLATAAALGVVPDAGTAPLEREIARVDAVIAGTDGRGLVHGDPCPDNVVVAGGRLRLLDFERTTPGHVALDAGYLEAPFPSCWCFARLPPAVVADARAAHRAALVGAGADVGPGWDEALAAALATWLIARGPELADTLAAGPPEPWGTTTMRPRLVAWADACAAAPGAAAFPALGRLAADLGARFRQLWPDVAVPAYPPFAGPAEPVAQVPDFWEPTAPPSSSGA